MHACLAQIFAEKRKEVDRLKKGRVPKDRDTDLLPIRDFKGAISMPTRINLIAEIKFASPSEGIIREKTDARSVALLYEEAGAAAISLLTDTRFFGGDLSNLPRVKRATSLPIVRKDFIIDEIQVRESFLRGGDAILLISHVLSRQKLKTLIRMCRSLGMAALTEVHDQDDLNKALACGADIIGINNRDLDTFEVDLSTTLRLASLVPPGHIIVSESGIKTGNDVGVVKRVGVQAILVGSSLMKSEDMGKTVRDLIQAGGTESGQD
jgi:indole-3-glycerol phosphate synthase